MSLDAQTSTPARARLLPLAVLIVFGAGSLATFSVTRQVVDDQETRLLKERTDAVAALLSVSIKSAESSLGVVGRLGSSPALAASTPLFGEVVSPLVTANTATIAVAAEGANGFAVLAGAGDSAPAGAALTGERAALLSRALRENRLVSSLVADEQGTRVIIAMPTTGPRRAVAFEETAYNPATPIPPTPGSPFRELRVALYASKTNDPSQLLITTEKRLPLMGRVEQVPFPVGADTWLLAVGARRPLVGSFTERVPWLFLGVGIITTLLAAAIAGTLARRRTYALRLVGARTRELGETRAFLERMLTSGPALVKRVTLPDRRISYVSPNVERVIGVREEDALSPGFLDSHIHPDDGPGFHAALDRVAEGASRREVHEHRVGSGDEYRWVSTTLVPDTDDRDDAVAVVGYLVDIDDRRRAEQAQREAQLAAEVANQSKSEFLSRMSHELRTPLNAVLGFGQLLELEELTDDQRESVDQILKGGHHLLDLINEVLDISRIESGELRLSSEAVLVSELVQETVDLIRPLAEQRGIQVVADRSGSCDCYVFADRQRAKQVLLNLLSNAVKYNRSRGTVAVSCAQPSPTQVRLDVADTGPGIPAERLGQLFTPFERLGAQDTDVEGTGIGLALSRRLTEAMGGTLTVASALGQGSTFSVELPRVEGPVERYERLSDEPESTDVVATEPRKVLHIEDNLANLKLVERVLARRPDIEVVAAMHGRLGLELAHEHHPVLVLLDLHLPDMGGEQVLQRLRDDPVTASIPVVIVSADATTGQVQRLMAAGATAYLSKPVDVRELLAVLDGSLVS